MSDFITKLLSIFPVLASVIAAAVLAKRGTATKATPAEPEPTTETEGQDETGVLPEVPTEVTPPQDVPAPPKRAQRYLHIIDNGHDALQEGKRSPADSNGKRFYEYEFNEDIRNRMVKRLQEEGVAYHVLVPDTSIRTLTGQRARLANQLQSNLPKLYHSIHANAGPAPDLDTYSNAGGIEAWHANGSARGKRMATITLRHLAAVPLIVSQGIRNRGVRSQATGQFQVLTETEMPAQLTEGPFYNNRRELELLKRDDFRQQWTEAHVQAILEMERDGI